MSVCKQCGGEVIWRKVRALKPGDRPRLMCYEPDGVTVHWDSCSKRRWAQTKATGQRFETEAASGYANSVHGTKFEHLRADFVTEPAVPIVDCPRCVPPWEVCPNGCPNAIEVKL